MIKKPFHYMLVLFGCLHMAGGPYAALQAYAWANMLVDYSKEDGLLQATKDTFSGGKPCALCCKIKAAEQPDTSSKAPLAPASTKMGKFFQHMLPCGMIGLEKPGSTPVSPVTIMAVHTSAGVVSDSPPIPPPKIWV